MKQLFSYGDRKNVWNLSFRVYVQCNHTQMIIIHFKRETIPADQIDLFKIFNLKLCVNIRTKCILFNNSIACISRCYIIINENSRMQIIFNNKQFFK